jgi:hypothetical protein
MVLQFLRKRLNNNEKQGTGAHTYTTTHTHRNKTIIKWKNIYHTVGTVPACNRKIVEICKFDIPNTHINDPSWLSSGTSIKSDGVSLVYSRFFWGIPLI